MADGSDTVNSIVQGHRAVQYAGMKRFLRYFCSGALFGLLVACAPVTMYYDAGAEVSRLETDLLNCQVSAAQNVPVSNQVRRDPPQYYPARRVCRRDGSCYTTGGFFDPGNVYTVDVNAGLRARVTNQCMEERGYRQVSIPRCSGDISRNAIPAVTRVLPELTPKSCIISNKDKTWQILNNSG
ncbi:hypothetical protein [uncultured Roseobacter sp.]|uniref:hypothetical protein n=1 Tax=uncultured Roseobacter sp. TaxID=114847 RepID=UPI0026185110|nr:hypothetical protein [uncultured Roseobacter sp.]